MKSLFHLAILILFIFFTYSHPTFLSPNYTFDYQISSSEIELNITSKNQGWVGFGFGLNMNSSEIFICSYNSNNMPQISHYNSQVEDTPHIINPQSVTLISGFRNTTHTSCTFKRSLLASASGSFNVSSTNPMNIIYGYGPSDALEYHTERGQANVSFYACGSYCQLCDTTNKVCLKCISPAVIIGSECQVSVSVTPMFVLSYYLKDENQNVSFTMTAQNQGWVALGLGTSMVGADIFTCNFTSAENLWKVLEFKSSTEDTPILDQYQNVQLITASRNSTHTSCTFIRSLKTTDPNDTIISLDEDVNIIYAHGSSDDFVYHNDNRGNTIIRIEQSLDFNNNDTLCLKGDGNSNCEQCKFNNFVPGLDGKCEENYIKDTRQIITENISLYYYIENNITLSLTLAGKSQGWIAVGLGASMAQADIFMCHINNTENQWEAIEYKSTTEDTPSVDKIQNLVLLFAYRNTTHTVCSFQRELKTNDSSDSVITLGTNANLIYAMGESDIFEYHISRGQFNMAFNNNSVPICDEMCLECEATNLCTSCKYNNFMVVNGVCEEDLDLETLLFQTANFSLYFYLLDTNSISFTMISNQQGWVALGLIPDQGTIENLIVCNEENSTTWNVSKYKYNATLLQKDDTQNVNLLKGSRNSTHTKCTIERQLITNESTDVEIKVNTKIGMTYGYGATDNFVSFTEKGEFQSIISNSSGSCSQNLCSQCNEDNTTCLKCKYSNYLIRGGVCLENYTMEKFVSLSSDFNLYYFIENEEISFSLIVKSQGYIALGLGSSMTGADIFMCNQSSQAKWGVYEMKSTGHTLPTFDSIQDLELITASRNLTHTLCTFRRKLVTDDSDDKPIKINQLNDVIFAIGSGDQFSYHHERGSSSINFSNSTAPATCPSNCLKCDSNSQCISCVSKEFVVINGICQENDIGLLSSSAVILQNDLTLYWDFNADNTSVTMMIKTSNTGYVALGIGKCMTNCDIHVVEYDQNSNVRLRDMYSSSDSSPPNDLDLGGTYDLNLLGYGMIDGYNYIKYERKVNTGDRYDMNLDQGDHEMAYAFSSGKTLEYHNDNRGLFNIHFVQGYNGSVDIEDTTSMTRLHGILMFVVWGGLIDVGLFFGRYLKAFKWYIEFHGIILFVVCALSTVMESLIIYNHRQDLANLDNERKLTVAHFVIGVILMGLYVLEITYGFIVKMIIEKKKKFIDPTNHKLFHKINGIVIYSLSKANIGIGLKLFKESLLIPLIVFYVALFVIKGLIEVIFQIQPQILKKTPKLQNDNPLLMSDLVAKINLNVPRDQLLKEFPQFSWVILDTQIYDISGFRHPGGDYILEQIKGREIGRFFYGISSLENLPLAPYKHTIYAFNYLSSRMIGMIENPSEQVLVNRKNEGFMNPDAIWMISEKKDLSKTTSLFRFRTTQYVVRNYIKGVEWMGKHFTVQDSEEHNKLTRLYTTVLCYSNQNINLREKLVKYHDDFKMNKGVETNIRKKFTLSNVTKNSDILDGEPEISPNSEELTLVIKRYNKPKAFSNYIHNNVQRTYIIRGNFGNGLELTRESSGMHYIFAGGTGILPFMDLLDYLLKKALFTEFNEILSEEDVDQINIYKENYVGSFNNNFKLMLFASFANDEEFIGSEIISKLYECVKEKKYNWFDMKIRISAKDTKFQNLPLTSSYFDHRFLKKNVMKEESLKKIYVCGPPAMNKKMHEELMTYGIDENVIHFV